MPFHSQTIVRKHGFKTTWEIDAKLLDGSGTHFSTKPEAVEGMPDVKWFLECDNEFPLNFYLTVESKSEVEYSLEYQFLHPSNTPAKKQFASNNKYVISLRLTRQDFEKYVKDGKLKFELEAAFSYKDKTFNDFNACDAEWGLRLKQSNSEDFNILVDGQSIGIHKFIVTAESPVFATMFESDFKEAKESKITIPDFKDDIVQAAINYCYRQDISYVLKDYKNVMELLRFCDKYDFQTLKPKLEKQIVSNLSKENVFYIASTVENCNALQLRQACIDFIRPLLNNAKAWPNVDMSEIDAAFFKDIVVAALDMKKDT